MSGTSLQPFLACPLPAEVLALARYRAQTEDELSLAPGDVVRQVCAGAARGWMHGHLRGRRGLFPKNLVQVRPGSGEMCGEREQEREQARAAPGLLLSTAPVRSSQEIPEALWGVTEPRPRCARNRLGESGAEKAGRGALSP